MVLGGSLVISILIGALITYTAGIIILDLRVENKHLIHANANLDWKIRELTFKREK